ncbi:MAG TPA: gliding motility lipoprotein GldH [Chitinophagaceae bacterium]|nr:gliding motility lipoprotein GldH [Chitinophagaceae bacterium]
MKQTKRFIFFPIFFALFISSCTTVDLYEKTVAIPGHAWQNSFRPGFDFTIKDTASLYQLFFVFRHTEKYNYSNIYINVYVKPPGQDSAIRVQRNLVLATNEKGWHATAMDDIYEHRIALGEPQTLKPGHYQFTLEQIMRENPLQNVLDAGIRVEKKP